MTALGLFVLRMVIARPVVARVSGARLRAVSVAFWIALAVALVAAPVYVARRDRAVRPALGLVGRRARPAHASVLLRARVPRPRAPARALRSPRRPWRSGSTAPTGRPARSAGCSRSGARCSRPARRCSPPALRAMRRRPRRGRSRSPSTGSISAPPPSGSAASSACSCSGAACPRRKRVPGLAVVVPRFSNVAFCSVMALLGSGIGASAPAPADTRLALADLLREDDPRQVGPAALRDARRLGQPPAHEACARAARGRRAGAAAAPAPARRHRGRSRRRDRLRGRDPVEPAAAAEGAREHRQAERAHRPRSGGEHRRRGAATGSSSA